MDKESRTTDFLQTAKRDQAAAKRFFDKAMGINDLPEKVTVDISGANKAAISKIKVDPETPRVVRQIKSSTTSSNRIIES